MRNRALHRTCNKLIAMECAFAIALDLNYFIPFGIVLSGIRFIPYGWCFPAVCPLSILSNMGQFTMLLTGIDRLLSVLCPIWYKIMCKKSRWFAFTWLPLICYAIFLAIIFTLDGDPDMMVNCSINDIQLGRMASLMSLYAIVLSAVILTVYLAIGISVFVVKATGKNVNASNRKLAKSLCLIIAINLIGVIFRNIVTLLINNDGVDKFVRLYIGILLSYVTITVYMLNAPVLYFISSEYRNLFDRHFPWIHWRLSVQIRMSGPNEANRHLPTNFLGTTNLNASRTIQSISTHR